MDTTDFINQKFHLELAIPATKPEEIQCLDGMDEFSILEFSGGTIFKTTEMTYEKSELLKSALENLPQAENNSDMPRLTLHVFAENHTLGTIRNLLNIFLSREALICKALSIDKSHAAKMHIVNKFLLEEIKNLETLDELKEKWDSVPEVFNDINPQLQDFGIDLTEWFPEKKITFKYVLNKLDANLILGLIAMSLAVNNQALILRRTNLDIKETENEKFTFRTWLNRIGIKGANFKTERKYLLKNLSGDSAWKSGKRP